MNAPLHIFRSGRHIPNDGRALTFSEADLAATARAYDPAIHEAPLVIGHPKHDAPAWGWVKSLAAGKAGLEAVPHEIDAAFAELVAAGRYKKISAAFYEPDSPNNPVPGVYYLRHVGFLGAQPPAVKGLRDVSFADGETGIVEFSEEMDPAAPDESGNPAWKELSAWLAAQFRAAKSEAPATPGQETIPAANGSIHYEESQVTDEEKTALEAENAALKKRIEELEAAAPKLEELETVISGLVEKLDATEEVKEEAEAAEFAERLIGEGRLMPRHKGVVTAVMKAFRPGKGKQTLEFGEGSAKQPLAGAFRDFLAELPATVSFGEHATKTRAGQFTGASREFAEANVDPERLSLHAQAKALAKEDGISFAEAVRRVINQ